MANRPTQLTLLFLWVLAISLAVSFVTGLGLWYIHELREDLLREDLADLPRWTSACQTLHGLVNPLICIAFGYLITHIAGGWKMNVNRKSGVALTASLALLILTGAAIYYSDNRHLYFTIHLLAGLLLPFILAAHWIQARKWVKRNFKEPEP
jgi:hypothetical protein